MCSLNVAAVVYVLSAIVQTKCVGESEDGGFDRKRFDLNQQSCMESFDVYTDMIIRTQDSRAMGAKFLNDAEVTNREECQKMCCETEGCDVYIHEQKMPGSCYLFHCGSHEDFKCKFTQHRNYTSAILTLNNHLNELENQIKLTKHEEELNSLRKVEVLPGTTASPMLTSTKVPDPVKVKSNHTSRSQCSRYQFECRVSGECIAIYNACDGIPQCSDGSDEAPELDCPTLEATSRSKTATAAKKTAAETPEPHKVSPQITQEVHQQQKSQIPYKPQTTWQQNPSSVGYSAYGMSQQNEKMSELPAKMEPQQPSAYQGRVYGREGEGLAQQYSGGSVQWQGYPMQRPDEGSHIFNHKGTGLVSESSDKYTDRKDIVNRIQHGQVPYNGEVPHSDYGKYNPSGYYGPMYYPNAMQQRQQQQQLRNGLGTDEMQQRPGLSMYGNGMSAPGPSDYYYEDSALRGRVPVLQDPRMSKSMENGYNNQESEKEPPKKEKPKITESVKKTLEHVPFSSTKIPDSKTETTTSANGKTDRPASRVIAAELSMSEADLDAGNDRPSGAILSLTLGMCITAIMIALVGCRLRVVRRRMRRSSKSPFAHDADFLVNGMYL